VGAICILLMLFSDKSEVIQEKNYKWFLLLCDSPSKSFRCSTLFGGGGGGCDFEDKCQQTFEFILAVIYRIQIHLNFASRVFYNLFRNLWVK
jgi:hypothetical protein